jgi:PRD1 phage membrane DNA delivery
VNQLVNGALVVLTAIIGVAVLSVILSKQSQTVQVLNAGSKGFSQSLRAAMGM